ncbi:hypothetical protein AVEN_20199-1 [Araneus ventricosus]|uniref:Uncharacterized protein n=1 Tax=Araneus ventricosus TaxID=182803 RepID=A0A4Y2CLG3_ARAVE|nr:hypothetical protein AVEN_20199-1 [Araneus ventricosus]
MQALQPSHPVHHGLKAVYMQKDLQTCSNVFVKRSPIKRILSTPFEDSFLVRKRQANNFAVLVNGQDKVHQCGQVEICCPTVDTTNSVLPYTTKYGRKVCFRLPL